MTGARKQCFRRDPNPLSAALPTGSFETTTEVTVIIAKLLIAAFITNIW